MIVDNASTHKAPTIQRWMIAHPRFHVHFTPTSSSWLNLVERWFGLLSEKQIKRGVHCSVDELVGAIMQYVDKTNLEPKPFIWTWGSASHPGCSEECLPKDTQSPCAKGYAFNLRLTTLACGPSSTKIKLPCFSL